MRQIIDAKADMIGHNLYVMGSEVSILDGSYSMGIETIKQKMKGIQALSDQVIQISQAVSSDMDIYCKTQLNNFRHLMTEAEVRENAVYCSETTLTVSGLNNQNMELLSRMDTYAEKLHWN